MATLSKCVPIGTNNILEQFTNQKPNPTTIDKVGGIYCHICHLTVGSKKDFDSHYKQHGTGSADIIYTCVVCHKEIVGYPSFRGHCYLAHVVKDKFKCGQCDKMFSKQCILQTHIKTVHKIITCPICKKQFKCQKEFFMHEMVHKNTVNGPPYQCQTCGDQIETSDDCEHHIEDHCTMFYSCPICNEDSTNLKDAANHLTKHFDEVLTEKREYESATIGMPNDSWIELVGGILCSYCERIYNTKQDFDSHFLLDHPDKEISYACNICGKEFEKYMNLGHHGYNHTAKDKFKCEDCSKTFNRLSLLVIHMEAYHFHTKPKNAQYPYTCRQCKKGFLTDRRLKEHYRGIHNIYYSQCPEPGCSKTFDTPKDLMFHVKEHNSVHNNNWCRQCGLRFYSLEACEKHLQYHKKKSFLCPICNRNYGEKYLLLKHLPQHFSSVLHVCKVCGKIYNSGNRLMEHSKVHSEIKPHTCSICGKGFAKTYALQQHKNIHLSFKPIKCSFCSKTFANYPNLRKHERRIHSNKTKLNISAIQNSSEKGKDLNETQIIDEISNQMSHDTNNFQENAIIGLQGANTSVDMSTTTHSFEESSETDNQWTFDGVDPIVLEILEQQLQNSQGVNVEPITNIDEFQKDLWSSSTIQLDSCEAPVPYEYGPEFVSGAEASSAGAGVIPLGDPPLPHIDPRLTLLQPPNPPVPVTPTPIPSPKWEPPILTKLDYYDFDSSVWDQITI